MPGSIRIFRAFGIDVFVHWSWLVVAVIWYQLAGRGFENELWNLGVYVGLFAIVTLHEFGHALACKSVGGRADTIVLWPLGGVAFVQPPPRPGPTLWSIAAGPLVNVILVPVLALAVAATGVELTEAGLAAASDFEQFLVWMGFINIILLVFNMLPIYPLDGGQVLQSLLWFALGRSRSLKVASGIGLLVAVGAIVPLLMLGEFWLLIIAVFVAWQAWSGFQQARQMARLGM